MLRIATYNIRHGSTRAGGVDVELLARTCAVWGVDVLALQEVDLGARRSGGADIAGRVAEATGMVARFGETLRLADGGRYGNALLVRGDIHDVDVAALPRHRPWYLPWQSPSEPRAAVVARVVVDGTPLSVATTHLSVRRREARRQLRAVAELLVNRPGPWLLLGDCNLGPRAVNATLGDRGFEVAAGPPTFPAERPVLRIDHVAARGARITRVHVPDVPVSDHRPLIVELDLVV